MTLKQIKTISKQNKIITTASQDSKTQTQNLSQKDAKKEFEDININEMCRQISENIKWGKYQRKKTSKS